MTRWIVEGGHILTMDPALGEVSTGDILIEDGTISSIDDDLSDVSADRIDATGHIVLPGFVNPHIHLYQTQLRGIFGDLPIRPYLDTMHGPIDTAYSPRDMYLGTRFGAAEQLDSGVTTVFDFCHNVRTPQHADEAISALEATGIRAIFGHGPPNGEDVRAAWYGESDRHHPTYLEQLVEQHNTEDTLVEIGMAARGPDFSTEATVKHDMDTARELDIHASMHGGVRDYPGYDPRQYIRLARDGYLDRSTSLVHAIDLPEQVRTVFSDADIGVITTPEPELHFGEGIPGTGKFIESDMTMAVGVDTVVAVSGDPLSQARLALQLQRAFDTAERSEAGREVPELSVSTREALEWITRDAATVLGLDDRIGSITPGKRADLVMLRRTDINTTPSHVPTHTVTLQASSQNVRTVLVNGQLVKHNGRLLQTPSRTERQAFLTSGRRLAQEGGLDTSLPQDTC